MAMCCFVSIAFPCNEPAKLRELAAKYLSEQVQGDMQKEAVWFLEALASERGYNCGPKGEVFTWGLVSNHCVHEAVVEDLMRFFSLPEFWKVGPVPHERIIAFFEKESSRPIAYEIETNDWASRVWHTRYVMPFRWGQE